jgi:uncharacterized protein (DUF2147 family)
MTHIRHASAANAIIAVIFALVIASTAQAADPTGEWLAEDGVGKIRIEKCADAMWGLISREMSAGMRDMNAPDAAGRPRPSVGTPVLLGMKQTDPNRWEGKIYNPMKGMTYAGNINLESADQLRVQACMLGRCGGQTWTRVPATTKSVATASAGTVANQKRGMSNGQKAGLFDSAGAVCKAVAEATGNPTLAEGTSRQPSR